MQPEESLMEYDQTPNPLRKELGEEEFWEEEFLMEGKKMKIPIRPGLAITLNRRALEK